MTYWSRTGAAALAMLFGWTVITAQQASRVPVAAGQVAFVLLAIVATIVVVTAVLQSAAEAFAREKKEDTLGLLFLTPLKPYELAAGKLISTSLPAFYRFVAMVPVLGLPILAGGVSMGDFLVLVVALVHLVFLGATVGLYCSARSWDEKRAASIATLLLLCFVFVLPGGLVALGYQMHHGTPWSMFASSPIYPVWYAAAHRTGGAPLLWGSILWTQLLGWVFLGLTCRALPHCWRQRPEQLRRVGEMRAGEKHPQMRTIGTARTSDKAPGRHAKKEAERQRLLEMNPAGWLAKRKRPSSPGTWTLVGLGLIAPLMAIVAGDVRSVFSPGLAFYVFVCLNGALKMYVATQASYALARGRAEDPLELLLSTTLSPEELVRGQVLAIREAVKPWIWRLMALEATWLGLTLVVREKQSGEDAFVVAFAAAAMLGLLVPDIVAVGWWSLWRGVVAKSARDAEFEGIWVLLAPWLPLLLVAGVALSLVGPFLSLTAIIGLWLIFSLAANRWFTRAARRHLAEDLRLWALRRAASDLEHYDFWKRLGRWAGQRWKPRARPRGK